MTNQDFPARLNKAFGSSVFGVNGLVRIEFWEDGNTDYPHRVDLTPGEALSLIKKLAECTRSVLEEHVK